MTSSAFGRLYAFDGATSRLTVGYGFVSVFVGGVGAVPNTERIRATTSGVTVFGSFSNQSDRNAKQHFARVNPTEILAKVAALPISEWSYKDDPSTRHIGPMGQDFYPLFKVGSDERSIAPIDEGGIAFAAIQGLNSKVDESAAELRRLVRQQQEQIEALKAQLDTLKASQPYLPSGRRPD